MEVADVQYFDHKTPKVDPVLSPSPVAKYGKQLLVNGRVAAPKVPSTPDTNTKSAEKATNMYTVASPETTP